MREKASPSSTWDLFRSAGFTWGTILAAFGIFALFGLLFTAPQFFQAVLGVSPMGSGVRLLPMMARLSAGAALADRAASRLGAKVTVAFGSAVLAAGLMIGAMTGVAITVASSAGSASRNAYSRPGAPRFRRL